MRLTHIARFWKSIVVYTVLPALVGALLWLAFFHPPTTGRPVRGPDSHNPRDQYNSHDPLGENGSTRKAQEDPSIASRILNLLDRRQFTDKEYVNQQFVKDPISSYGVNEFARKHYGITALQAAEITKATADLRLQIASHIAEHLEILENPGNAQRAFVYRGSKEFSETVKLQLRKRMVAIVNEEFADASLNAIKSDTRFFEGGVSDLFFYINPGIEGDGGDVKIVRYESRNEQGERGSSWEGPAENLKEGLLLDFDWETK